ncbi:DUF1707 SHOCT-like domain-containing protein [Kribbella speibonae]|uniref:DUF1707 domain-containing protein n=1 Tax=Kribbella speibonae TaxID=1572660 RepID=A0A4R0J7K1_9ACTN|nr:DUF1707 domain-containing protein [Kribbella speibonae]TCC17335.1 DUF1707 domain-containing protein [Kribbella speibonae]TCC42521.1 DUF1707 domain-containing protein [Kribbella speibonae]
MNNLLEHLLTPDQVQLTDADRRAALAKLDSAVRQAALTPSQASDRHELVLAARTRGELRNILSGVANAAPPRGLTVALQAVSGVWLVACVVQFAVWVALAVFGHFDGPWWLWSDLGLGAVVAILWFANESYHRKNDVLVAS